MRKSRQFWDGVFVGAIAMLTLIVAFVYLMGWT